MRRPTCAGVPSNDRRSFSKISTPLKRAAAVASSFSLSVPAKQTVAIAVCTPASSHGFEVADHALSIGLKPAEQTKRVGRLEHRHAAAPHGAAAERAGRAQQL